MEYTPLGDPRLDIKPKQSGVFRLALIFAVVAFSLALIIEWVPYHGANFPVFKYLGFHEYFSQERFNSITIPDNILNTFVYCSIIVVIACIVGFVYAKKLKFKQSMIAWIASLLAGAVCEFCVGWVWDNKWMYAMGADLSALYIVWVLISISLIMTIIALISSIIALRKSR